MQTFDAEPARFYLGLFAIIFLVGSAVPSSAATIDGSIRRGSANILVQNEASQSPPFPDVLNRSSTETAPGTEDYVATTGIADAVVEGSVTRYEGRGGGTVESSFVPSNPGLGNEFYALLVPQIAATSEAEQTDPTLDSHTNGFGSIFVDFTLARATRWAFAGHFIGNTTGVGQNFAAFAISDNNNPLDPFVVDHVLMGDFDEEVSLQGILPPGSYQVTLQTAAIHDIEFTTGEGTAVAGIIEARFVVPEPHIFILAATLLGVSPFFRRQPRALRR
jgi:hypothetical protein